MDEFGESMKIVFVSEWIENIGGAEAVLAASLKCFDTKVKIFALWNNSQTIQTSKQSFLSKLSRMPRTILAILSIFAHRFWFGKYDLVITFSHLFAHGAKIYGSSKALRVNYIHSPARYLWYPEIDNRYAGVGNRGFSLIVKIGKMIDRRIHPIKSINIANSKYVAQRIEECWGVKAQVCYPPVDTNYFAQFVSYSNKPKRLISAGRLVSYKGFENVIQTASELDWPVTIIGDGPERGKIQALACNLNVNLNLIPFCSREELAREISSASVFVFGGIEDFGILPVESMACGTPGVGLNKGGLVETITPGGGFLVDNISDFPKACISASKLQPNKVSELSKIFSQERFISEFKNIVTEYLSRDSYIGI